MSQSHAIKREGQHEMAQSTPVAIASDQDSIKERYARRLQETQALGVRDDVSLSDRRGRAERGSTR